MREMGFPLWVGSLMLFLMVLSIGTFLILTLSPQILEKLLTGLLL